MHFPPSTMDTRTGPQHSAITRLTRTFFPSCVAAVGRLCEKCDGKCPVCDSYVRPSVLVRICDECNYGSYQVRTQDDLHPDAVLTLTSI